MVFIKWPLVNSLWPSDAIWRQGTESTLAQVMACCLTAPSHYLNQCWLIISKILCHSSEGIIMRRSEDTNQQNKIEKLHFQNRIDISQGPMSSFAGRHKWVTLDYVGNIPCLVVGRATRPSECAGYIFVGGFLTRPDAWAMFSLWDKCRCALTTWQLATDSLIFTKTGQYLLLYQSN